MDKKAPKELKPAIRTLASNVKQLRLVCDALRTPINNETDEQFLAAAGAQLHLLVTSMRQHLDLIENITVSDSTSGGTEF